MPDSPEYLARVKSLAAGENHLDQQRQTPAILSELVSSVPEAKLRERPLPHQWSVSEIIAHLAEDELVTSWRYRQMLENDGVPLAGFDQDLWAEVGQYRSWNPHEALTMFRLLREANLRLLKALSPEQWQRHGLHAERGRITVQDLARHMAGHDLNHLEQIRKILSR